MKKVTEVIASILILLFVYAAASKLMDYEKFLVQLSQSNILTGFARTIAWLVPAIEILISILLLIPGTRRLGFEASFMLMAIFITYIFSITHFTDHIPCSCGGVLETMTWNQHIVFNIFFLSASAAATLLSSVESKRQSFSSILQK